MKIEEMISKIKIKSKKMSKEDRLKRLQRAKIVDENGIYCKEYFTEETVKKSQDIKDRR